MKIMGAARATVLLGLALFAAAGVPVWANEPQAPAPEAAGIAPPAAEPAPVERAARPADPASAGPETTAATPLEPPIEAPSVAVAAPEPPVQAPAAAAVPVPDTSAAAVVSPADRLPAALAARLADQPPLHPRLTRKEREAMAAFYALGNYQPMWVKDGAWTAAGQSVVERLKGAGEDGLSAADYPIPSLTGSESETAAVDAELKLSAAAVMYARDARGARIEPSRLSNLITPDLALPAADAVLTALGAAKEAAGAALAAYNPPHEGYRALKAKLAELRAGDLAPGRLADDIVANMERWRWLPPDMGVRHVFVNVPEFKLRLMKDGRAIHEARVIVGKPETPTPLFSDEMDHAIVNPSWYVPPSIFKNEFNSDPYLAASRGYDVIQGRNGAITVRQPPGERNALGFVKFMFPNKHAVYLHDTPNRRLFAAEKRAMSHGCVRLDQPFRFGEFVLGTEWTEARLKSLIGRGERTIRLPQKVPVHLAYFTTFVDERGEFRQFADLYGVNNKVRAALGMARDGTPVADAPRGRKPAQVAARTPAPPRAQARRKPARPVQTAVRAPEPEPHPFFWLFR